MASSNVQVLADFLDPRVRVSVARALSESLRGRLPESIKLLTDDSVDSFPVDAVGRELSLSHLWHLNRQSSEALALLDRILSSDLAGLSEEIRLVIEQNRIDVCYGSGWPASDEVERRYGQVDRRRLLGVNFREGDALLDAAEASLGGKNYDSLPVYNALLFQAYRSFDWHLTREMAGHLCRELIRLGQLVQAGFCAILSESEEVARFVADHLRTFNDVSIVNSVVGKMAECTHLSRHITCACHFLEKLGDAIPDGYISLWLERLKPARSLPCTTLAEDWAAQPALKATTVLLGGANTSEAQSVVDEVLQHPLWGGNGIARDRFYKVLEAAAVVIDKSGCRSLAQAVIPYVIAETPDHDFRHALHVLMTIAERWPTLKAEIRKKVYRRGRPIPHLLASAAPFFEQAINLGDAKGAVHRAIAHLRLQVEQLAPGAKPTTRHGESVIQNKPTTAGSVAVKIGSCMEELGVLIQYRQKLSGSLKHELAEALIDTLSDPENENANRASLFRALGGLSDSVDAKTARKIADVASRYASDHRADGHPLHGQPEQHSPLNPFRMGLAWPQDVRGEALLTLAQLSRYHRYLVGPKVVKLILAGIADPEAAVRRSAYHAVYLAGPPARSCLHVVVGGIRDSDASAANVALQVVGAQAASISKLKLVPTVLTFLESHCRHPDVGIRRAVAAVTRQTRAALGRRTNADAKRLDTLADQLRADVSRSVRAAVSAEQGSHGNRGQTRASGRTKLKSPKTKNAPESSPARTAANDPMLAVSLRARAFHIHLLFCHIGRNFATFAQKRGWQFYWCPAGSTQAARNFLLGRFFHGRTVGWIGWPRNLKSEHCWKSCIVRRGAGCPRFHRERKSGASCNHSAIGAAFAERRQIRRWTNNILHNRTSVCTTGRQKKFLVCKASIRTLPFRPAM